MTGMMDVDKLIKREMGKRTRTWSLRSVADHKDKYSSQDEQEEDKEPASGWPELNRKRMGDDGWLKKWYNGAQIQLTLLDQPGRWMTPKTWYNWAWGIGKFWWSFENRRQAAKGVSISSRRPSFDSNLGTEEEREQIKKAHNSEMPYFPPGVMNPRAFWRFCWDLTLVFFLMITLFAVTFRLAFEFTMFYRRHDPEKELEVGWGFYDSDLIFMEYFLDMFFFINWVFKFRTAFFKRIRKGTNDFVIVTEPKQILNHALGTSFFMDAACGVPWEMMYTLYKFVQRGVGIFEYDKNINADTYPPPSWTRLPRILMLWQVPGMFMNTRVSGMDKYVSSMREQFALHNGAIRMGKFLMVFYTVMHIIACVLFYLGSDFKSFKVHSIFNTPGGQAGLDKLPLSERNRGKSWITEVKIVISTCRATSGCATGRMAVLEAPITRQYIMSLYWVATTMTQCGYGDISPYTQYEVASLIFGMVCGATLYSYIVGNAASLINDMQGRSALVNEELDAVSSFMVEAGISKALRSKCLLFFSKHKMSPLTLLVPVTKDLPHELTAEVKLKIFARALYRPDLEKKGRQRFTPLLDGLRRDTLAKLLFNMYLQETVPLETLWLAGDQPPGVAFVLAGTLEIVDVEDNSVVCTIFPGNYVGENLLIPGEEISPFTVRTKGWCDIIMFSGEHLAEALNSSEEDEYWMLSVARARWSRFLACFRASKGLKHIRKSPDKWGDDVTSELIMRNVVRDVHQDRLAEIEAGAVMTATEERRNQWNEELMRFGINENGANGVEMFKVAKVMYDAGFAVDWSPGFVDNDVAIVREAQMLHDKAFPKARLTVHVQYCRGIKSNRVRAVSSFNPFCRILVYGRSFETTVKEDETSPEWDEMHIFKFEKGLMQDTIMSIYVLDHTGTGTALIGMTDSRLNVMANPGKFHILNMPLYDEQHNMCGTMFMRYKYDPMTSGNAQDRAEGKAAQKQVKHELDDMLSFDPGAQAKRRLMDVLNRVSLRLSEIERKTSMDREEISRLIAENIMSLDSLHALGVGNALRSKLIDVARLIPAWQSSSPMDTRSVSRELSMSLKSNLLNTFPILTQSMSPGVMSKEASMDPSDHAHLWKQYTSRSIGRPFWYNKYTKETRWTNPTAEAHVLDTSPFQSMVPNSHSNNRSSHSTHSGEHSKPTASPAMKLEGVVTLQDLPLGWVQRVSQRKSLVYYQNMTTGATSWSAPQVDSSSQPSSSKVTLFAHPETPRAGQERLSSMIKGQSSVKAFKRGYSSKKATENGASMGNSVPGGVVVRVIPSRVPCRPESEFTQVVHPETSVVSTKVGKSHPTLSGMLHQYIKKSMDFDQMAQWVPFLEPRPAVESVETTGRMSYREGDARMEYSGNMCGIRRQGSGVLKMHDGVTYCGHWTNDSPDGFGVEVYTDGSVYKGEFSRDKRNGFGAIFNGDLSYCGGWTDGMRNGSGIEVYMNAGEPVECLVYVQMGVVHMRSKIGPPNQTEYEMLQDLSLRMINKADEAGKMAQKACDEVDMLEEEFEEMFPESEESIRLAQAEKDAYSRKPQIAAVNSHGSRGSSYL